LFAIETGSATNYAQAQFQRGDALLFGSESSGLPAAVLHSVEAARTLSIPMRPGNRSLNLANAVALVVYEAWRQQDFASPVMLIPPQL
jgi:tRNA (cytidine/uridine-2'-O-)-methyltransferase